MSARKKRSDSENDDVDADNVASEEEGASWRGVGVREL